MEQSSSSHDLKFDSPLVDHGVNFWTIETYYQAMKVSDGDLDLRRWIASLSPGEARQAGQRLDGMRQLALEERELSTNDPQRSRIAAARLEIIGGFPEGARALAERVDVRTEWPEIQGEVLRTAIRHGHAPGTAAHERLLSTGERELNDGSKDNPISKFLTQIRSGGKEGNVDSLSRLNNPLDPHERDGETGLGAQRREQGVIIKSKTSDTPKIIKASSRKIDRVQGEVPIGGEFEITYKYAINDPATLPDGKKPEEYGKIEPLTPGGSFTDTNYLGLVGEPKVTVNAKKETIEVEKTERYRVEGPACPKTTCAINFKIVVTDPVNTDKTAELRSTTARTVGDKRPEYIPVRNVPKPERYR